MFAYRVRVYTINLNKYLHKLLIVDVYKITIAVNVNIINSIRTNLQDERRIDDNRKISKSMNMYILLSPVFRDLVER